MQRIQMKWNYIRCNILYLKLRRRTQMKLEDGVYFLSRERFLMVWLSKDDYVLLDELGERRVSCEFATNMLLTDDVVKKLSLGESVAFAIKYAMFKQLTVSIYNGMVDHGAEKDHDTFAHAQNMAMQMIDLGAAIADAIEKRHE